MTQLHRPGMRAIESRQPAPQMERRSGHDEGTLGTLAEHGSNLRWSPGT